MLKAQAPRGLLDLQVLLAQLVVQPALLVLLVQLEQLAQLVQLVLLVQLLP